MTESQTSHRLPPRVITLIYGAAVLGSALLLIAAWTQHLPLNRMEAVGFVAGAWCVWLAVKQNIWNWPIGIANNIAYIVVFWHARLYADMSLQGIYIAISLYGWYSWLFGGVQRHSLRVAQVTMPVAAALAAVSVPATWGLTLYLRSVHDAAPFLDALTTVMSLCAQYLLARKQIENWYVWIAADVIYLWLYTARGLYLTTLLYFIFMLMCVAGAKEWRGELKRQEEAAAAGSLRSVGRTA